MMLYSREQWFLRIKKSIENANLYAFARASFIFMQCST
jgi:hypothetical protein